MGQAVTAAGGRRELSRIIALARCGSQSRIVPSEIFDTDPSAQTAADPWSRSPDTEIGCSPVILPRSIQPAIGATATTDTRIAPTTSVTVRTRRARAALAGTRGIAELWL